MVPEGGDAGDNGGRSCFITVCAGCYGVMVSNLHQSSQGRIIIFTYFSDEDTEAQKYLARVRSEPQTS